MHTLTPSEFPIRVEDRHSWKAPKRERVYLGRVVDKKTGKVIFEGVPTVGRLATPHPLHGHLKKIVVVKIPTEGGFFMQRMKLKTAIQKGYYSVNATNPKDKAAIEKALEPSKSFQNRGKGSANDVEDVKDLREIIAAKTPNA